METLVANLTGKTRRVNRNGREYVIAPVSMIVPGVLNGSQGPILYTAEENVRSVDAWNGMPLVVYHPKGSDEKPVSARSPEILDEHGVGEIFNSRTGDKGELLAEAWFDVDNVRRVDTRVMSLLEKNDPFELSTGLNFDRVPVANGTEYNGTPYNLVARNYRPDHLAILPDQKGACSVDDGCGVLVNQKQIEEIVMAKMTEVDRNKVVDGLIANDCCWEEADREVLNSLTDEKLGLWKEQAEKDQSRELVVNAAQKGFEDKGGNTHTFNAEKNEWESKMKTPEPEKKLEVVDNERTGVVAPQTAEEWMKTAPQEIQNTLLHAQGIEAREKALLIDRFVTNAAEKDAAKKMLGDKSLNELQGLLSLIPQETPQPEQTLPSYLGQSVPAFNAQPEFDEKDVLTLPVINHDKEHEDSEAQRRA